MIVGMKRRMIRGIQIVQLAVTLTIVLVASGIAGLLGGNLALRFNDIGRSWYDGPLQAMVPFAIAAFAVAVLSGSFLSVRHLRSEDLKRE